MADRVFIRPGFVRAAIDRLAQQTVHPAFAGYLCMLWAANLDGRQTGLKPDFADWFGTFLAVDGGPPDKPYFRPFWNGAGGSSKRWMNRNVAGSFAPSSLRDVSPFLQVITVAGARQDATYGLKPKHWELARVHLTGGMRLSALDVAAFLYRDFRIEAAADTLTTGDLVDVFRAGFGLAGADDPDSAFHHLFVDDGGSHDRDDVFEEVD